MKLQELKTAILKEGRVDPNILMNIDEMVAKNKVTTRTQYIIIAKVLLMLKQGIFQKNSNWYEVETPADVLAAVRAMPEAELLALAKQFQQFLYNKDQDFANKCFQPTMSIADWLSHVNQANS